jgi:arylformamidase
MNWFDVTVPIRPGMVVYEGDPPVCLERAFSLTNGDLANVSRLDFGVHTGTHIDAPIHFLEGGAGIESVPLDALIGPAVVIDATSARTDLGARALAALGIPAGAARVLFKTTNSRLWELEQFSDDFIGLMADAAQLLVLQGVRLVGIDYLSIAPKADPAPTHRILLEAGCVILEGLDLRLVAPGNYDMVALPLLIPGSDGSPVRALLRRRL